ncbi:MAG: hypothetical protein A2Z86_08205 [Candidatus Glassbacteria bacterium GWA2_58_10]|uniref:Flavodoxin-like domain-containing protein n=1 Tax=Candidatus Glassbacteria bacterium GWA2_58_10 TaxID=1817865 RepID=A0A1F5YBI5_9BACT|nr:MAG: hypothetical protein A2Z86_08205 [Candidatus Glassbacteria bacterium GWA2_58_10]
MYISKKREEKMEKRPMILSLLLAAAALYASPAFAGDPAADSLRPGVLLLYSSGEPLMTISDIKGPEQLEGITQPTPVEMNTRIAAERIKVNLEKQGVAVVLKPVQEVTDWREVMQYKTIVIGSATRFWNVTWETKRFFDDLFLRIYVREGKAKGKLFAIFTTTEIEPSGERTLAAMESTITDCGGNIGLRMILHRELSLEKARAEIDKFSTALAILAR